MTNITSIFLCSVVFFSAQVRAQAPADVSVAVQTILTELADSKNYIREQGAQSLVQLRRKARPEHILDALSKTGGLSKLLAALGDTDALVRMSVAQAIGLLRVVSAVTPLSNLVAKDPDPGVRHNAAIALGYINAAAPITDASVLGVLTAALNDSSLTVRLAVIRTLGEMRVTAVTTQLTTLSSDSNPLVRDEALRALSHLGGSKGPTAAPTVNQ